jgi:cysteine desulfurase/selenocysteine lyase
VIVLKEWDADFVAFSGHKMLGPSGVGVLWGKKKYLEMMPPYQFGGEMVLDVNMDRTEFKITPHKFEAGTPNIAGVIAFKEAIRSIQKIGYDSIRSHEQQLRTYALSKLKDTFGDAITILGDGNPDIHCGIVTFTFSAYHAHDIAQILDESHIAVRAGHHCTMPLHKKLGVASSVRASFYIYNTESDVDALLEGLKKVSTVLK